VPSERYHGLRLLACGAFTAVLASSTQALAARPLELKYAAPAPCPSRAAFEAGVLKRAGAARRNRSPLVAQVEVARAAFGLRGTVSIQGDAAATVREVRAERCEDVTSALALILAILLNPEGANAPTAPRTRAPPARRAAPRWLALGGLELAGQGAIAPRVMFGPRFFIGIAQRESGALLSSARLSGYMARSGTVDGPQAQSSAAFRLDSLRLDACAIEFSWSNLAFEPCLFVESGVLAATGSANGQAQTKHLFWAAAGPLLRGSLAVWKPLVLEAELGAALSTPSSRYSFVNDPAFYQSARLGITAGLGAGVHFP
jgi:hypothetical protein